MPSGAASNHNRAPTAACIKRLQRELQAIVKMEKEAAAEAKQKSAKADTESGNTGPDAGQPAQTQTTSTFISARPHPDNILQWYFLVAGPAGTPYEGGRYIGSLVFPPDYPFKPPTVSVLTPNGRFITGHTICMSNTNYHPEQWSPIWSVQTIVLGFVSFMVVDSVGTGGLTASDAERRRFALESRAFNINRLKKIYQETMPEHYENDLRELQTAPLSATETSAGSAAAENKGKLTRAA